MQNWYLLVTIFGRLYQIYIKMKNIPDIYWPGVFQYHDSNRTTDGSHTWISFIDYQPIYFAPTLLCNTVLHLRVRNLGLACKIGTFLGPNLDFGPIWDQVPNLGLHYSAWADVLAWNTFMSLCLMHSFENHQRIILHKSKRIGFVFHIKVGQDNLN